MKIWYDIKYKIKYKLGKIPPIHGFRDFLRESMFWVLGLEFKREEFLSTKYPDRKVAINILSKKEDCKRRHIPVFYEDWGIYDFNKKKSSLNIQKQTKTNWKANMELKNQKREKRQKDSENEIPKVVGIEDKNK